MTEKNENFTNAEGEIDTEAALADISAGLFGQDDAEMGGDKPEVPAGDDPEASPVETPLPEEKVDEQEEPKPEDNSAEVQAVGAPATWTKDGVAEWAGISQRAQQEILKREEDMFRGLEQYREKAEIGQKYEGVIEPYRAMLAAEQIDPVGLFESFAGNHYLLTRGTPEQKLSLAANMISHYGIDVTDLVARMGSQAQIDPAIQELQKHISGLESKLTARETSENEARFATFRSEVDAFSRDPKNIHFEEVANDMAALLNAKGATSLTDAYEKAIWANPVTRQKELDRVNTDRKASEDAARAAKLKLVKSSTAADVKTSAKNRDGTAPVGSMDDTLKSKMEEIASRGD